MNCSECGEEIQIRHYRGRLVPFGCTCHQRRRTPRSFRTTCPVCGSHKVYLIRYNGGVVWLDDLGAPWPIHGCFKDQKTLQQLIPGAAFSCLGDLVTLSGSLSKSAPSWSPTGQGELITPSYSHLHLVGGDQYEIASDVRICSECLLLTRTAEFVDHNKNHSKK